MKKLIVAIIVVFLFCTSMQMADLVYRSEDQIKKSQRPKKLASYAKFWSVKPSLDRRVFFCHTAIVWCR
ncbi:MAG: hypothetical protein R3B41_04060 [Candidatus Doudnabacteria bacterium]